MKNLIVFLFLPLVSTAADLSGTVTFEPRFFFEEGLSGQDQFNGSLVLEPQFSHTWNDNRDVFNFEPFFRLDQKDNERTHFDIRELAWERALDEWEIRLGVKKVFWGVTESQHLVDVVNQTDFVENVDGEDKLGQPMVNVAWVQDFGTLDLFALIGFRERTFAGRDGRLQFALPVDSKQSTFESSRGKDRVDWALRWSKTIDQWDVAVSYFTGTSRDPSFNQGINSIGETVLVPHYSLMDQVGVEALYVYEAWILKFESIFRYIDDDNITAFVGGFEHSFYGVIGSADIGLLVEYHYDDRSDPSLSAFQNDLFWGGRLALNDEQSTELLSGFIVDLDTGSNLVFVEATRRLDDSWALSVEIRGFLNIDEADIFHSLRQDSFVQAELEWFF